MSSEEPTRRFEIQEAASSLLRGALRHARAARLAAALVPLAAVPVGVSDVVTGGPQAALAQSGGACSASGGFLQCLTIPAEAQCSSSGFASSGRALALIAGGRVGLPQHKSLLVTSCNDDSEGVTSRIYFIDTATGTRVTLPGNPPKTHLTTTVTPPGGWNALSYRIDRGDLLACSDHGVYRIDLSPFNTVADGTTIQMGLLPTGSVCDAVAWDHTAQRIYQSGESTATVRHYALPETAPSPPTAPPSTTITAGSCPNEDTLGVAVAGPSLFVGCRLDGSDDVKWLNKNSPGTNFGVIPVPSPASPGDLECDPITFKVEASDAVDAVNQDALWTKDRFSNDVLALPVPPGVCSLTTATPVANPAACPANWFGDPAADTDGDAMLDCWEDGTLWTATGTLATVPNPEGLPGIDFDGNGTRDLILCVDANGNNSFGAAGSAERITECAHANRKDVFVEIDYMRAPAVGQTSHRPNPLAISDVQAAFAAAPIANPTGPLGWATGVRMHVQIDDSDTIPHVDKTVLVPCTLPGSGATNEVNYDTVKAEKFGTVSDRANLNTLGAKRFAFRWVLFGHNQAADPSNPQGQGGSGCAEILGNDALVSMGTFSKEGGLHNIGSRNQQAATLMHEIGHLLGLRHGGGGNTNCLVNYISVMNYAFQFDTVVNTGKASTAPTRWRLDYSRQQLGLGLNEAALNEGLGVGAFPEPNELLGASNNFIVFGPANVVTKPTAVAVNPLGSTINWNKTGTTPEQNVRADLNNLGISGCGAAPGTFPGNAQTHVGFDDWANLRFNFRASTDFADGAHSTIDEAKDGGTLELAFEDIVQVSPNVLDLVPFDAQNRFRQGTQYLPVAFLSSELLDARDIDLSTAKLSGLDAGGAVLWVASLRQIGGRPVCQLRDVNQDTRADVVCAFDVRGIVLGVGENRGQLDATATDGRTIRNGDVFQVFSSSGTGGGH